MFWGGGVDTQRVLGGGTPDEVRAEVRRRAADLAPGDVLDAMNHAMVKVVAATEPPPADDLAKLAEIGKVTP